VNHFWQEIEGYFTFPDFYQSVALIASCDGPWHGVEVGAYTGQSAAFLAVELNRSRYKAVLDLVDIEMTRHRTRDNLSRVASVIGEYHEMDSVAASKLYDDESLDFVFIDADHSYSAVSRDIDAWLPKVRKSGIMSGHDYKEWRDFGVIQAVTERFARVQVWRGMLGGGDKQMQDNGYWPCWAVQL
jgi:Methyltransferase domain